MNIDPTKMSTDFYCTKLIIPLAICSMSESSESVVAPLAPVFFCAKLVRNLLNFKLERLYISALLDSFFSSGLGSSTDTGRVYIRGVSSGPGFSSFSEWSYTKEVYYDMTSGAYK